MSIRAIPRPPRDRMSSSAREDTHSDETCAQILFAKKRPRFGHLPESAAGRVSSAAVRITAPTMGVTYQRTARETVEYPCSWRPYLVQDRTDEKTGTTLHLDACVETNM